MNKWDAKYAVAPEGLFGDSPCGYVREIAARSDFNPKTALFLADGDGRNSRWLAARGIAVSAVDASEVAVENGRALDSKAAVSVERIAADLESWKPVGGQCWDSVFQLYLQAPPQVRFAALKAGWRALAAGGWLVVEGFSKAQVGGELGPGKVELMYDLSEIEACVADAKIMEALVGRVRLDEGERHQGLAEVVRFAARKA
ncbi:MAG: class I SAM-dependent methyltransferase [Alphaproteobacteria bacterium]|nr:class I SAM-dependent methyltransferase [Alphaproteobacteria bacterium]